jgi:hypothetical protein
MLNPRCGCVYIWKVNSFCIELKITQGNKMRISFDTCQLKGFILALSHSISLSLSRHLMSYANVCVRIYEDN